MTSTFLDWLHLIQTDFDVDNLNKREIELAELAWNAAQDSVPAAWLVTGPYEKVAFADHPIAESYCRGLNEGYGEEV